MSLYDQCERYEFQGNYNKIRELFEKEFPKRCNYFDLSEEQCQEVVKILEDFGCGELVDVYVERFGSLPPRSRHDENWTTIAARIGSVSMLKKIHEYGYELDLINEISGSGVGKEKPLDAGIFDEPVVEYLLRKGADPFTSHFGYYVSHPETYSRKIVKMIWDADPNANQHGITRAFELKSKSGVEWFIANGARFKDRRFLAMACRNLWADIVIFLMKELPGLDDFDLVAATGNGKSPLEMAFESEDAEKLCRFFDELMPRYKNTIELIARVPAMRSDGSTKFPCGHWTEEKGFLCPVCGRAKYELKNWYDALMCFGACW